MGIFNRQTPDRLEEKLDTLRLEDEVANYERQIAEKKAAQAELKRLYGPRWMQILGIGGNADISTLRSFLRGAKQGLVSQSNEYGGSLRNPVNLSHLRGGSDLSHLRKL